ncbi:19858_t:CDS:2, partial [Gigaspora rosea]
FIFILVFGAVIFDVVVVCTIFSVSFMSIFQWVLRCFLVDFGDFYAVLS